MDALDSTINAVTELLLVFAEAQSNKSMDIVVNMSSLDVLTKEVQKMVEYRKAYGFCCDLAVVELRLLHVET